MDIITPRDLENLLQRQTGLCTSIYLPTHISGPEAPQDALRLKNLVAAAREKLIANGLRPANVRQSLEVIEELSRDAAFWDYRGKGLAVFLSDDTLARFRLAMPVDETVVVNRRFHVKQLLPAVAADGRFYVLALSRNRVRLLEATSYAWKVAPVADLPKNLDESLNLVGADRGSQVHTAMHGRMGKQAAVFHGQGGQPDTAKEELLQYFQRISAALRPVLRDSRNPLILACVEYEAPIFREACDYPHIADELLTGNFDYAADHEIYAQALPIARQIFDRTRERAAARYRELADTNRAANRLDAVLPAAHHGRVETLFVDRRAVELGAYDPAKQIISYGGVAGAPVEDLLDRAAVESLLRGAAVYAVPREQMPDDNDIAAVFRY